MSPWICLCLSSALSLVSALIPPTTPINAQKTDSTAVVPSTGRTVYGRITGAVDGDSLVDAKIVVVGAGIGTATDSRGAFRLSQVPDGAIRLRVRHPCFLSVEVDVPASGDTEVSVGLPLNRAAFKEAGCGGWGSRHK